MDEQLAPKPFEDASARLASALNQVGLQVTVREIGKKSLSFECRESDRALWLLVMKIFLTYEEGWTSFIAQRYILKAEGTSKRVAYCWFFSIKAEDVVLASQAAGALLLKSRAKALGQVKDRISGPGNLDFTVTRPAQQKRRGPVFGPDDMPRVVGSENIGMPSGGTKGAYLAGRAPTGGERS